MQAILYIGHGTRIKKGVEEALHFIEETKKQVDISIQETAFLELAEPNILQGIKKCVERGATRILIAPILLLAAQHAKEDIPAEIEKASKLYPNIKFTLGRPFGIHEKLIDTVYKRITEQQCAILPDAEVLLVGRGSSDRAVIRDMREISNRLQKKYKFHSVRTCFLYGTGPSFENTMNSLKEQDVKQLFIVPYLLFSGLLSIGIQKKAKALAFDESRIILCNSLGYDRNVRKVLVERVLKGINNEGDEI
ncbi:sirohydrochlorin chelatase [Solibacillus cecembensis]|uniref:sirohydrochlorin chelatase n=1 Tax=Solibacillus cecembensis TaxID=459347 RepID=UPI000716FF20